MGHIQSTPSIKSCASFITAETCQSNKLIVNKLVTESSCNSFISSNNCSKYFPPVTAESCSKLIPKCPAPLPCPTFCPSPAPCPAPVPCPVHEKCPVQEKCPESTPCPKVVPDSVQNKTQTKTQTKVIDISDIKNIFISDKISSVSVSDMDEKKFISPRTKTDNNISYVVLTQFNDNSNIHLSEKKCISVDNNLKVNINNCNVDQPNTITWLIKPLNNNNSNLIHMASGKCLDAVNNKINLSNCDDKNIYQKWEILENNNSITIKQNEASKCLETNDSSNIVLNNCTGNDNQLWNVTK